MNSHNKKNYEEGLKRKEAAYQEWLANGKKNRANIAKKHNTDPTKFSKYILEKGHSFDRADYHIFDKIDTQEKAYWLGFMYADGYIATNRNTISLELSKKDFNHLKKFKSFLKSDIDVKVDSFRARYILGNTHLHDMLIKHGCTPKKSFTIEFPTWLKEKLIPHFIRGYFDGDGMITRSIKDGIWDKASICSGSKKFLESLINTLIDYGIKVSRCYRVSNSKTYFILIQSNNFVEFMQFIYKDATIYLDRKYNRFLNSTAVLLRD